MIGDSGGYNKNIMSSWDTFSSSKAKQNKWRKENKK